MVTCSREISGMHNVLKYIRETYRPRILSSINQQSSQALIPFPEESRLGTRNAGGYYPVAHLRLL